MLPTENKRAMMRISKREILEGAEEDQEGCYPGKHGEHCACFLAEITVEHDTKWESIKWHIVLEPPKVYVTSLRIGRVFLHGRREADGTLLPPLERMTHIAPISVVLMAEGLDCKPFLVVT